jgi:hypothetical protein
VEHEARRDDSAQSGGRDEDEQMASMWCVSNTQ